MRRFAFYPAAWTALFLLFVFRGVPLPVLLGLACVVWASVAVHELGHVVAAILAGGRVTGIRIHPWHGRTTYRNCGSLQGVVVALAGPAAGFLSAAVAHHVLASTMMDPSPLAFGSAMRLVLNACMLDNVLNLTPVWVLDGRSCIRHFRSWRRELHIQAVFARARTLHETSEAPTHGVVIVGPGRALRGHPRAETDRSRPDVGMDPARVEEPSILVASI